MTDKPKTIVSGTENAYLTRFPVSIIHAGGVPMRRSSDQAFTADCPLPTSYRRRCRSVSHDRRRPRPQPAALIPRSSQLDEWLADREGEHEVSMAPPPASRAER